MDVAFSAVLKTLRADMRWTPVGEDQGPFWELTRAALDAARSRYTHDGATNFDDGVAEKTRALRTGEDTKSPEDATEANMGDYVEVMEQRVRNRFDSLRSAPKDWPLYE